MKPLILLLITSHLSLSAHTLFEINENWSATLTSHTDPGKIRSKRAELQLNYDWGPGIRTHAHIGGAVKQKYGPSAYIGSAFDISF